MPENFIGESLGAMAGQALIPIPGVGGMLGKYAGGMTQDTIENLLLDNIFKDKTDPTKADLSTTQTQNLGSTYRSGGALPGRNKDMNNSRAIGQNAREFVGPKHEQGGIPLPGVGAEVEGGETLDDVGSQSYVFSDETKVPGTNLTFAEFHKRLVKNKASKKDINRLAALQEQVSGRNGKPTGNKKMNLGGFLDTATSFLTDDDTLEGVKGFAKAVAPYAGDLTNIARGALGGTNVPEATKMDRSHIDQMQTTVDTTPQQNAARQAYRSIAGDPSASTGEKLVSHGQYLNQLGNIHSNKINQEAQLTNQKAKEAGRANMIDARFADQRRREVQQAEAAQEGILNAGISGLSQTYQRLQRDKNYANQMSQRDMIGLASSLSRLPEDERNDYIQNILPLLPAGKRQIFESLIQEQQEKEEEVSTPGINSGADTVPLPGNTDYTIG